jgi:excisionase family DNA binding protein
MTHVLKVFGVTIAEAARLLGVSPSHIYRLIASDPTFPKLRKVGRASRLDPQELREWYDAQLVSRHSGHRKRSRTSGLVFRSGISGSSASD